MISLFLIINLDLPTTDKVMKFNRQPTFGPPIQTLYFETKRTVSENLAGGGRGGGHGAQTSSLKYHSLS